MFFMLLKIGSQKLDLWETHHLDSDKFGIVVGAVRFERYDRVYKNGYDYILYNMNIFVFNQPLREVFQSFAAGAPTSRYSTQQTVLIIRCFFL